MGRHTTCARSPATAAWRALVLTVAVLVAASPAAATSSRQPAPLPIVAPGQDASSLAERCLGLVLMSDKSKSQEHTDPRNLRIRAATFALDMLGALSNASLRHIAGVVSFGSTAPAANAVGMRPLPDVTRELSSSLAAAPTLGGTSFPAAFARVERLVRSSADAPSGTSCQERRFAVFVYTDLIPNSGRGAIDAQFAAIQRAVRRLRVLNARVHVFAFTKHRDLDDLVTRWRRAGAADVAVVQTLSNSGLERSYANVLAQELGLGDGGTARLNVGAPRSSFDVPDLTDRVIVVPFALSRARLRLISPNGDQREIHGLAVIDRPAAGRWSVQLVNGASTAVGSYAVPAAVRIASPGSVVALGSQMRPEVTLRTGSGAPVGPTRSSVTVDATATIDGRRRAIELEAAGDGRFVAKRAIDATPVGPVSIAASVAVGAREVRRVARTVEVLRVPYLAFTGASPRAGRPLRVPLELRLGGHAVNAASAIAGSRDAIAVATLRSGGRDIEDARVRWLSGSRFEAHFAHRVQDARRYAVTVEMVAREGRVVPSPQTATVRPHLTLLDRVSWWVPRLLVAIVAVLFAIAVAGGVRMAAGRRIDDDIVVPVNGEPVAVYGWGRRVIVRGGPWPVRPLTFVFAVRRGPVVALKSRLPRPWGARPVARPLRPRAKKRVTSTGGGSR